MTPERWKQISQLYEAARSRSASARQAYLVDVCGSDEALRREVQALLDQPTSPTGLEGLTSALMVQAMGDEANLDLTGHRLGVYVIHERIGVGGMSEVYRARDTRLGRDVAIKVLPPAFADDADRLARFEREARVLAALDHPHIATIYGVEEIAPSPGTGPRVTALVLALVEGDTLADRIARGPLPSGEALEYARQIASALEAAHDKGIVHRDLKPANIKITPAGLVKVLDFGLAKTEGVPSLEPSLITVPAHATRTGMVLGTPPYMSPEQARGQEVDKRTDIWAFGCVVYEMLTGRAAFARDTISDTVAAILAGQIDWTLVPVATPPIVQRLLRRCLVEAAHRLRDIGDARLEIDEALAVPPTIVNEDMHTPRSRWRDRVAWIVAVFGLTAFALGSVMWLRLPSADVPGYRSELMMPPGFEAAGPPGRFAISPDGSRLAFTARNEAGTRLLWVRALNESAARSLAGTDGAEHPFWSPDSRTIAFYANAKLKKIAASGGAVFTVCDAGMFAQGGTWNRDDVILFNFGHGPLFRVSANGGTPTQVTSLDREAQETGHAFPFFLPDGEHFLYLGYSLERTVAARGEFAGALYADALGSPARTQVLDFISHAEYARGHILFVRDGALLAQSFDPDAMMTAGPPSVLVEQLNVLLPGSPVGAFSTSDDGVLAFEGPSSTIGSHLLWVDRQGREVGSLGSHARYAGNKVQLSPDGKRALVSRSNDGPFSHVVVIDTDSHLERRLTFAAEREGLPVWSPDGTRVALARGPSQALAVYIADSNGSGAEERLISDAYPASWSRDGRFLLYHAKEAGDLWVMPMIGARKPFPFLVTPVSKWDAQFSPDGRWVAYTSFESGRFEVFVSPFAETDSGRTAGAQPPNRWRVSSGGGDAPRWRTDGKEIFYWSREDTKLMAVPVKADGARFDVVGRAEPLFSTRPLQEANPLTFYDVSDDGQHFLINAFDAKSETPSLGLIVNWPALLKN